MSRYKLMSRLDARELADVFLANRTDGGRSGGKVLCKIYFQRFTTPEFAHALAKAAQEAQDLNLPGVLAYDEVGFVQTHLVAIRECIDGYAMDDVLHRLNSKEVVMTPQLAVWFTSEVARVVGGIHAAGAVHGALGSTNILVGFDGRVAVSGMGMMRAAGASMPTRLVAFKLHRGYRAPEQRDPCTASSASDVYALGCLLYELLTMVPVSSVRSGGLSTKRDTLQPPSRLNRRINAHIDPIVMRALEQVPSRRYPNAADFADALMGLFPAIGACPNQAELGKFAHEVFPNEISLTGAQTGSSDWPIQDEFSLEQKEKIVVSAASSSSAAETAEAPSGTDDFSKLIFDDLDADFFDDIGAQKASDAGNTPSDAALPPPVPAAVPAPPAPPTPSEESGNAEDDPFGSWDAPPGELPKIVRRVSVVASNPAAEAQPLSGDAQASPETVSAAPDAGLTDAQNSASEAVEPEPGEPLVLSDDDIESLLESDSAAPPEEGEKVPAADAPQSGEPSIPEAPKSETPVPEGAKEDTGGLPWSAEPAAAETVLPEAAAPVPLSDEKAVQTDEAGGETPAAPANASQAAAETEHVPESVVEASSLPPLPSEAREESPETASADAAAETAPAENNVPLEAPAAAEKASEKAGESAKDEDDAAQPAGAAVDEVVDAEAPAAPPAAAEASTKPAADSSANDVAASLNQLVADMPSLRTAARSRPQAGSEAIQDKAAAQADAVSSQAAPPSPNTSGSSGPQTEISDAAASLAGTEWDDAPQTSPSAPLPSSSADASPAEGASAEAGGTSLDSWDAPAGAMPKIVRRKNFGAPEGQDESDSAAANGDAAPAANAESADAPSGADFAGTGFLGEDSGEQTTKSNTEVSIPVVSAVAMPASDAAEPASSKRKPKRRHRSKQEGTAAAPLEEEDWHVKPPEPMKADPSMQSKYARKTVIWIIAVVVAAAAAIGVVQAVFSAKDKAATADFAKDTASKLQSALSSTQESVAYLSIQSDEPATVVINGQKFEKDAPFEEAPLPPGHIMVRLIHGNDVRLVDLDLEPGKLTRASVTFAKPQEGESGESAGEGE